MRTRQVQSIRGPTMLLLGLACKLKLNFPMPANKCGGLSVTFGHLIETAKAAVNARGEAGSAKLSFQQAEGFKSQDPIKLRDAFYEKQGHFRSQEAIFKQALEATKTYLRDTNR